MPDKNGNKTLRDSFPIYCAICGDLIRGAVWKNEELVEPAQEYWQTGIVRVDDDWVSTYAHRECRGMASTRNASSKTLTHKYDAPQTCLYCAKECDGKFCSERCRALHENDIVNREPSIATLELIERLRQMRHEQFEADNEKANGDKVSSGGASNAKNDTKQPAPQKTLDLPKEELPPFVPQNEFGVVFMFGNVIDKLGYRMAVIDGRYPDAVVVSPSGQAVRIEFEYQSSNFVAHQHDPELCDLVVCWTRDRNLPLPIIALSQYYNTKNGQWNFSDLD